MQSRNANENGKQRADALGEGSFVQSQRRSSRDAFHQHEFLELVDGIERALVRFESTSNHAVLRLYRRGAVGLTTDWRDNTSENTQVLNSAENEHVFLVYFFIFTLQEFAGELVSLVDAMGRIYSIEQAHANRTRWWTRLFRMRGQQGKRQHRHTHPSFPKVRPHAPNTIQTPDLSRLTWIGRVKQRLWMVWKRLTESDTKYAVKAGMATALLAAPAFFDATRPFFVEFWGDWALISFFIVISPTIGATNFLSLHRVLGTLLGAGVAAAIYTLFPDNAIILTLFGFFFSIPCFYYIVAKPQYISASRFVLLTYNLTCLYCYNLREKELSAVDVAIRRAIAVTVGVVWAALVSRFWWPAEARRELSKALGELSWRPFSPCILLTPTIWCRFCLNMGWLYTRLVASNSFCPNSREEEEERGPSDETRALSPAHARLSNSIKEFMAMCGTALQIKLIELQGLLALTQHEPRLKGPFPVHLYRSVLTSLQTILDKLHSMRCVTTREEWYTSVRQDFILPVNKERREMVGNIILSFSTLASAFRLKAPLPPYLPPAEVAAIRKLDVVRNREVTGSRQLLFFAYALTMKGVTEELESLGRTLQNAFGVIGQTPEEFEALFMDPEEKFANRSEISKVRVYFSDELPGLISPDLIRKAKANPDKSGNFRRNTLKKLIDLTHTPHPSLKILAAQNIPDLYSDFPDQEEAAINAVYDLCEDQSAIVRKQGYEAITAVSRAANKWVKRNTDVLLQLLQSDEPDEVVVVKQALIAHLDLEPRVTLGVLCDQVMPAVEATADAEELYMRDRLRALVLAFLNGEAKRAIVERHALPDSDAEHVLVNGLMAALPKLSAADTEIVVKKLLFPARQAQLCLKADLAQNTLATTRFYIDLMAYLVIEKPLGTPIELMRFYLPSLVAKMTIQRLSTDDQIFVICSMAEALSVCEKNTKDRDLPQLSTLRNQSVDASPNLFECVAKAGLSDERSRNACKVLLQCCLRRKADGWLVPAYFRAPLEDLRAKAGQYEDVLELIRVRRGPLFVSTEGGNFEWNGHTKSKPKTPEASTSQQKSGHEAATAVAGRPPSARRSPPSRLRESPVASTSGYELNTRAIKNTALDPAARPGHRSVSDGSGMDEEKTPRGGYSIKGAASAKAGEPRRAGASTSLLERMNGGGGGRGR
ncbi:Fusaric acid resistance protein-like-domain-containing protein [Mycena sp. CBHHK59/15]|nr:Fusaric acid resistance protein-like-domain-containing protein [Mycena sp. CBHHK59/15]KAJ6591360.1 Fusaric acid resistance protein-like-domain-containing protein [Mycena sp. CBHHK59/15]